MKRTLVAVTGILMLGVPLQAAFEKTLSPGKYVVTVSPPITEQTADQIENQLDKVSGIGTNDAKPEGSSVHFAVKDEARVDIARIKDAIKAVVPEAKVSDPMVDAAKAGAAY